MGSEAGRVKAVTNRRILALADHDDVPSMPPSPRVPGHCSAPPIIELANQDDVRRIALSLPETCENKHRFAFSVRHKPFAWVWFEPVDPKKGRVPNPEAIGCRVSCEEEKYMLIDAKPDIFFTEPHYNGYPAVLVWLPKIELALLEEMIHESWQLQAPRRLAKAYDETAVDS